MAKKTEDSTGKSALELAIGAIDKKYGVGTVYSNNRSNYKGIDFISSQSIKLDEALGGGFPCGRIIEIAGHMSAGKTTIALHACKEVQKMGYKALYIDREFALDIDYAERIGINVDDLLVSQVGSGEDAINVALLLAKTKEIKLIVVDSVAALTPQAEIDGIAGDMKVGLLARLMSQACRLLIPILSENKCSIIFINQIRDNISFGYGPKESRCGGKALDFYSTQILDIRRIETLGTEEDKTGIRTRVKVIKNKVAAPFKIAEFNINFGTGIDSIYELAEIAIDKGIVKKSGAWLNIEGLDKNLQGMTNLCKEINSNETIRKFLIEKINDVPVVLEREEDVIKLEKS